MFFFIGKGRIFHKKCTYLHYYTHFFGIKISEFLLCNIWGTNESFLFWFSNYINYCNAWLIFDLVTLNLSKVKQLYIMQFLFICINLVLCFTIVFDNIFISNRIKYVEIFSLFYNNYLWTLLLLELNQ